MENKGKPSIGSRLASNEGFISVAASLICIVLGLALGLVALAIINYEHAWNDGLIVIITSGLKSPRNMGTVLANAAPLIMTGLSVGFAFKTGLFNIGAAGQYTLGALGALYCAIVLQLPWYVCLLAAMVLGAIWGAIPGLFKAYLNINEVITAIMFNWIGLYMVNDIMYGKGASPMYDLATTKTFSLRKVAKGSMIPSCGMSDHFGKLQSVTIAIFIAIFFAIVVYIVLSMTIAGALAGVGAGLYYLSTVAEWNPQVSTALPAMGFNGISAALLACSNPIGTIFSSLFISYITVGGTKLSTQYYTKEIADVITALIIYLCAFSMLFKGKIRAMLAGKTRAASALKGGEG